MNVRIEAQRLAWGLRKEFQSGGVFQQAVYRAALAERLRHLEGAIRAEGGDYDAFVTELAEEVDREACPPPSAEQLARMQKEFDLLRPYWGDDMTMIEAVRAYYAANPAGPPDGFAFDLEGE